MYWRDIYQKRLCSAKEAVSHISSGNAVVFGHCVGEPEALVNAMVENAEQYRGVELKHMVSLGQCKYAVPEMQEHFTVNPFFSSSNIRTAILEGRGDFTPAFMHEIPILFREGKLRADVLLCMVSPPDEHGYCSLGTSVDYTSQVVKSAKTVIAQVNNQVPVTYGDGFVHVSELDHIVEVNASMKENLPPKITDIEKAIGEQCASLVEDGSTMQLGIGAIPDAVMLFLKDKKDLGIHSEMISDGTMALFEEGVITNTRKSMNQGKMTVTFIMGTDKFYKFAHKNPALEIKPADYVNHPIVISQQYKMIAINSAVQVDLMGQVVSEAIGPLQISGVGGQVDFVRGASMAKDGKAIIAMPSVNVKKDGTKISKIVPFIDHGAPVTTSRNDANYIVTEYGIAELKGKSLRQRARALIGIAHPDMRAELADEFEKRFSEGF